MDLDNINDKTIDMITDAVIKKMLYKYVHTNDNLPRLVDNNLVQVSRPCFIGNKAC